MNREIKFRVWDINFKHYCYEDVSFVFHDAIGINKIFTQKRYLFQQYVGLKDKNGKEIYEGDILQMFNTGRCVANNQGEADMLYLVKYDNLKFEFKVIKGQLMEYCGYLTEKPLERIVIGNIFENPELLK